MAWQINAWRLETSRTAGQFHTARSNKAEAHRAQREVIDSRPLVAMFDQPASHILFAGFIRPGNVTRVTRDLSGALLALKGNTVLKFRAQ